MSRLYLIAFVALAFVAIASANAHEDIQQLSQDGCLQCAGDIVDAVKKCEAEGTTTLECIEKALGAASDCIKCICEILEIIGQNSGICPPKV